jgi:hypothetical protein
VPSIPLPGDNGNKNLRLRLSISANRKGRKGQPRPLSDLAQIQKEYFPWAKFQIKKSRSHPACQFNSWSKCGNPSLIILSDRPQPFHSLYLMLQDKTDWLQKKCTKKNFGSPIPSFLGNCPIFLEAIPSPCSRINEPNTPSEQI